MVRLVLCAPGPWRSQEEIAAAVEGWEVEFELGSDERMADAFGAAACRVRPSLSVEEIFAIRAHSSVIWVTSEPIATPEPPSELRAIIQENQ